MIFWPFYYWKIWGPCLGSMSFLLCPMWTFPDEYQETDSQRYNFLIFYSNSVILSTHKFIVSLSGQYYPTRILSLFHTIPSRQLLPRPALLSLPTILVVILVFSRAAAVVPPLFLLLVTSAPPIPLSEPVSTRPSPRVTPRGVSASSALLPLPYS